MKKILATLLFIALLGPAANAQLGGILRRAAEKATEKAVDKATDKAADAAAKAVEDELNKQQPQQTEATGKEVTSLADIMKQMPALPTAQQFIKYKEAELNEQTMKMVTNPVTSFNAQAMSLSMEAVTFCTQNLDSAEVMDAAYKQAEATTGLTREEIDKLSTMSEAEQEAYLKAHYQQGHAEAAMLNQAVEASKYLEPLQPKIDEWEKVNERIEGIYKKVDGQCREIYKKYADKLADETDKNHNSILMQYYSEIVSFQRDAVEQAMKLRLNEQMPIAEKIEEEMVVIRKEHQDFVSALLNYPQLTATQYFMEYARVLEIPEYKD
ncbi:MAG: hypothetical protein K6A41_10360 [Bacteroidales bacterium]|nr:hypothetical protein [Bacteroidales bacterium]